jgi:hypothetical protein
MSTSLEAGDAKTVRHELNAVLAGLREFERQALQNGGLPSDAEPLFRLSLKKLHSLAESLAKTSETS